MKRPVSTVTAFFVRTPLLVCALATLATMNLPAQTPPIDAAKARQYFAEAQTNLRSRDWRKGLTPATDIGQLLAQAYAVKVPATTDRAEALRRAERYDGGEVIAIETEKEEKHRERVAAARKSFVDAPVLVFPVSEAFRYTFDPNAVLALDDKLTLYEGDIQVSDAWGLLKTTKGALFLRENGRIVRVQVPAPTDASKSTVMGKGWTLELKPQWQLTPEGRAGDFAARKSNP